MSRIEKELAYLNEITDNTETQESDESKILEMKKTLENAKEEWNKRYQNVKEYL